MNNVLPEFFAKPDSRLLVIAGPCILEDPALNERIGTEVRDAEEWGDAPVEAEAKGGGEGGAAAWL